MWLEKCSLSTQQETTFLFPYRWWIPLIKYMVRPITYMKRENTIPRIYSIITPIIVVLESLMLSFINYWKSVRRLPNKKQPRIPQPTCSTRVSFAQLIAPDLGCYCRDNSHARCCTRSPTPHVWLRITFFFSSCSSSIHVAESQKSYGYMWGEMKATCCENVV